MRLLQLTEIESLSHGEIIPSLAGTIKSVFPQKSGTSEFGDWTLQDAVLADNGTEVRLTASNLDDFSDWKGQSVLIECSEGKKGLTGVSKVIQEYQGKTYHKVKLTPSCKIHRKEGVAPCPTQVSGTSNVAPTSDPKGAATPTEAAIDQLKRAANGMYLAIESANYVRDEWNERHPEPLYPEHFQAMCASLFIHLDREGLIRTLPADPISK